MLQQATDVPTRQVRQAGVALLVEEQRLAALPQRLVHVHTGPVVHEDRLGHERDRLAGGACDVLDDVLVEHQLVGHAQHRVEAHVDLGLARGADLVVLDLDLDADGLEHLHHLGPQVLVLVHRRDGEVALLVPRLVREVGRAVELELTAGVPHTLDRVEEVVAGVLVLVEARGVEDVELGFGPEVRRVGDAGALQVLLGLLGDVARVARVGLAGDGVLHEAVEVQRRVLAERIEDRGVRVRDQEHVGFLDLLEAADRRAVEAVTVLEAVLGELVDGHREVLHHARQVTETQVDELGSAVLREPEHVLRGTAFHGFLHVQHVPMASGTSGPAEPMGRRRAVHKPVALKPGGSFRAGDFAAVAPV